MKRTTILAALAAIVIGGAAYAASPMAPTVSCDTPNCVVAQEHAVFAPKFQGRPNFDVVQVQDKTTTVQTTAPVSSTTVVKGGDWAASILAWFQTAFVGIAGVALSALGYKALGWLGVQVTDQQKAQLQGIIVNGLNAAGNKAQVQLRNNPNLDINVKSQIVADAVTYTQNHAADTIKALGLDPNSGQAIEAIKARIETALNDPTTPTPPAITPATAGGMLQPFAPKSAA